MLATPTYYGSIIEELRSAEDVILRSIGDIVLPWCKNVGKGLWSEDEAEDHSWCSKCEGKLMKKHRSISINEFRVMCPRLKIESTALVYSADVLTNARA